MSGWTEDDFLEAMMPVLRKKQGPDWCPDADTLSAVVEGNASEALKEAVAAHTAACPVCTSLHERLRNFDQASIAQGEAAWGETEKRLDNWMEGVLAGGGRFIGKTETPKRPRWREKLGGFFIDWRMQVALGAAAAVVIMVAVQVARRSPEPVQIATRSRPPELQVPGLPTPAEGNTGTAVTPSPAPKAQPKVSPKNDDATRQPVKKETAVVPVPPPVKDAPPTEIAKDQPPSLPASSAGTEAAVLAAPQPQSNLAAHPATLVNEPARIAKSDPPPSPNASSRVVNASRATPGLNRALSLRASGSPLPAAIQIDAGTRVWITLKSVNSQTDGSFEFRGTLLLPVTQAGGVLLDRGTDIQGSGRTGQGRPSLQIAEFTIRGARYALKDATGGMSRQAPGAGGAVQFDAGQVLEMFMGSSSVYERVAGENPPPQK